ncbi:unnamed protein product, partial [Prorocentrum cordatum]
DYEPAWADVRSKIASADSVDEAWKNVIRLIETVLIDRCGLGEQGSKCRGREETPTLQWVFASKPNLPRHPKLDTSTQWISQRVFEALLQDAAPHRRTMADQQRIDAYKALSLIESVFDAVDVPSAGCLAELVSVISKKHIEHAMRLASQRFGNWIDQQHALGGKELHAFTRERMPRHPRPPAADAPDGEDGPPLPVPADQQTCAELLVNEWTLYWNVGAHVAPLQWPADLGERPPRPTVKRAREVFRSFAASTGACFDAFRPRDFD